MTWFDRWEKCIEVLYPNVCVLCGEVLVYGSDRGVCEACESAYPYIEGEVCTFCGKPLINLTNDLCYDCQRSDHAFKEGRSMWIYDEHVKEAIHDYKYKEHKENGHLFAKELIRYYNRLNKWQVDLVVPVPLHKKRQRTRGYNQASVIAKYFARHLDYQMAPLWALQRVLPTCPQKELTDKERSLNVKNAFLVKGDVVKGKTILLVDDIYTTGSTIDGCTKALLNAGAREVYYLAVAIGRGL